MFYRIKSFQMEGEGHLQILLVNAEERLNLSACSAVVWIIRFLSTPAARSTSVVDTSHVDTSSQHGSDQSDTRTEHSDEDAVDKAPKRSASVRATKKPAAAKTEVGPMNTHTHTRRPTKSRSVSHSLKSKP